MFSAVYFSCQSAPHRCKAIVIVNKLSIRNTIFSDKLAFCDNGDVLLKTINPLHFELYTTHGGYSACIP